MKFEDVDAGTLKLFEEVRNELFPELNYALFKLVFRNKRKGGDESIVFAEIMSFGEFNRFLTAADANREDGYDYCMVIDKNIFDILTEEDKKRVLRHELRHCVYDPEKEENAKMWKIRKHTVEDFYEDIEIEAKDDGDPRWKERILEISISKYDEMKEQEKAEKKRNKK